LRKALAAYSVLIKPTDPTNFPNLGKVIQMNQLDATMIY